MSVKVTVQGTAAPGCAEVVPHATATVQIARTITRVAAARHSLLMAMRRATLLRVAGSPPGLPLQTLGFFHASRGNRRGVEDVIARLKQRSYPPPMYIAGLYSRLGEDDKAVEWMERAFKERDGAMIDLLSRGWAEARKKDPRIEDLAKRVRAAKR